MKITFTPLSVSDFPLLLKWLETPHVKLWWDTDIQWTEELIAAKYSNYVQGYTIENGKKKEIHAFIIHADGKEIGYIQVYNAHDFPQELDIDDLPESLASFDIFIGEEEYLYKNIWSKALKVFFEEFYTKEYKYVLASTRRTNLLAVNSYRKAGFTIIQEDLPEEQFIAIKNIEADKVMRSFWNSYRQAFIDNDVDAIINHYDCPCFIKVNESFFFDREDLRALIMDLLKSWKAKDFKQLDFKILETNYYTPNIIQAHLLWEITDSKGNVFVSSESVYHLSAKHTNLKIFNLINLAADL